jgi:predicted small integral membrane protein
MGLLEKIGLKTSRGDRIFVGMILLILVHLLWMMLIEKYLSLWFAFILSIVLLIIIIIWG